jgi:hypothetical protein
VAASSNKVYELENVGILYPERAPTGALYVGALQPIFYIYSLFKNITIHFCMMLA